MHQGVDAWLTRWKQNPEPGEESTLIDDIAADKLPRADAVKHLTLVIEAIVENYAEYRDYNSTTTQSDRGELLYTLLDFLRLRVHYDRVAWHLKPLLIAHAVLVRRGRSAAAETWRAAAGRRTSELADSLQNRYAELRKQYAMRLPTVADRLAERFIRPLAVDRARADQAGHRQAARSIQQRVVPATPSSPAPRDRRTDASSHRRRARRAGLAGIAGARSRPSRCASGHLAGARESSSPIEHPKMTLDEVQRQLTGWERHPH